MPSLFEQVNFDVDKPSGQVYLSGQVMGDNQKDFLREYLRKLGRKGGKARAAKYDKKTLSKWAKLGGRPPEKGDDK